VKPQPSPTQQIKNPRLKFISTTVNHVQRLRQQTAPENTVSERLLTADEAAQLLAVSPDWLYRHARRHPFARKLAPKMLRFSYVGIVKWLATRKTVN